MPALSHVQDCPLDHARSWDRVRLAGWAVCGTGIGYGWAVCGTETGNGSTAHVENLDIRTEMSKIYTLMAVLAPGVCPQHDILWDTLTARQVSPITPPHLPS
eukprot:1963299-Rhodomonas_salina.1